MNERIEKALEQLRPALSADGFDLRLESVNPDGSASVIVEARPDACYDCLVPDHMLVSILEQAIRREDPAITRVLLHKCNFEPPQDRA